MLKIKNVKIQWTKQKLLWMMIGFQNHKWLFVVSPMLLDPHVNQQVSNIPKVLTVTGSNQIHSNV